MLIREGVRPIYKTVMNSGQWQWQSCVCLRFGEGHRCVRIRRMIVD